MTAEAFVKRISCRRPNFITVITFQEGKQNPYSDNILKNIDDTMFSYYFRKNSQYFMFLFFSFNFVKNHKKTLCSTYTYLSHDEEHIVISLGVSKNEKKTVKKCKR